MVNQKRLLDSSHWASRLYCCYYKQFCDCDLYAALAKLKLISTLCRRSTGIMIQRTIFDRLKQITFNNRCSVNFIILFPKPGSIRVHVLVGY